AAVEGDLRDDVLLAEAARFHPRHRERIPRLQRAEHVVDDALRLSDLLRVGSGGVNQHVYGLGVAALVGAGRCRQSKQRREKQAVARMSITRNAPPTVRSE